MKRREIFIGVSKDTNLSCGGSRDDVYMSGRNFVVLKIEMFDVSIYIGKDDNMKEYSDFKNILNTQGNEGLKDFAIDLYYSHSTNSDIRNDIENALKLEFERGFESGKYTKQEEIRRALGL